MLILVTVLMVWTQCATYRHPDRHRHPDHYRSLKHHRHREHHSYPEYHPAAVVTDHDLKFYDVPNTGYSHPTNIDVPPDYIPINVYFRTASSMINVHQIHEGTDGSYRESYSHDEPHKLVHTVTKPIVQEIREIITPYRTVTQHIEPVKEEIQTVVARAVYDNRPSGQQKQQMVSDSHQTSSASSTQYNSDQYVEVQQQNPMMVDNAQQVSNTPTPTSPPFPDQFENNRLEFGKRENKKRSAQMIEQPENQFNEIDDQMNEQSIDTISESGPYAGYTTESQSNSKAENKTIDK